MAFCFVKRNVNIKFSTSVHAVFQVPAFLTLTNSSPIFFKTLFENYENAKATVKDNNNRTDRISKIRFFVLIFKDFFIIIA